MTTDLRGFVPELRTDFVRRVVGDESVVWSPLASEPTVLDAVSTVMLDVVDGDASIGELATDVHEEIGIPFEAALLQVMAVIERFGQAGLLTSSLSATTAEEAIAQRELFVAPPTPCSENASRLGTETLVLRLGRHTVRVACDSRRAVRTLRTALADHVVDTGEDAPLAFVLTAPQGLKRTHLLVDPAGFVLSAARGLDAGLHALASHLTALLPPAPGVARVRTRCVAVDDGLVVCLFPLLYAAAIDEKELARAGVRLVDRLAFDIDVATGTVTTPPIPWPVLRDLDDGLAHTATTGTGTVTAIIEGALLTGAPPSTPAAVVAQLAAGGLDGSTTELVAAAAQIVGRSELRSTQPEAGPFLEVLEDLSSAKT